MSEQSDQNRAGIFDGARHSESGIPLTLIDTKTHIEAEGGEFNFPESIQNNKKVYALSGSNLQVIKQIFKILGLHWDDKVTHVKSGDIIICIRSAFDDTERTYTGTLIEIISAVNESCGCKHVESGATMTNHETGKTLKMKEGGKLPELNDKGGYDYEGRAEKRAEKFGLITLPKSIEGTNCANCVFFKDNFCDHKRILLPVTSRQCCALWSDKSISSIIENLPDADLFPDEKLKEQKFELDQNGGFIYTGRAIEIAKNVDLITLPKKIFGTNCAFKNCKWTDANNFCTHPKILLPVTYRMSCSLYDNEEALRSWKGDATEISFHYGKVKIDWKATPEMQEHVMQSGGRIAQGYVIAPYSKLKKIFGEPNINNEKDKIGWYMAPDKTHIAAVWTEADKPVKTIMKEKFHKWFVWAANEESKKNLYQAMKLQVRDVDPVKQKANEEAISKKRWIKKREHITEMATNIQKIKLKVAKDLNSEDEKEFLTALVVAMMLQTSERVGNEESEKNGHCGVTGLNKSNITIIGNKVLLDYVGKSGVAHEKSFTDNRIAKALKKAVKKSPSKFVFETSDGFRIKCDKVNRYLEKFSVTAKNIRGFNANNGIIKKLQYGGIPEDPKQRKKILNSAIKKTAGEVGHGASTLKKHYMIPELPDEYITHGRIIDMKNLGYYQDAGQTEEDNENLKNQNKAPVWAYATSYFLNEYKIPDSVKTESEKLVDNVNEHNRNIQDVIAGFPVTEISYFDLVPMQEEMNAKKLEEYIKNVDADFPPIFVIQYDGKYYIDDGHHRAISLYLNEKPILAHVYDINKSIDGGDIAPKKHTGFSEYLEREHPELNNKILNKGVTPELKIGFDNAYTSYNNIL